MQARLFLTRPLAGSPTIVARMLINGMSILISPNPKEGASFLADDNADMRLYVERLLESDFEVEAVANGEEALQSALARPPDLVLSDIMMPILDGLGLLSALRKDPRTSSIPLVLLSARAGEESRIEGLQSGADVLSNQAIRSAGITRSGAHQC